MIKVFRAFFNFQGTNPWLVLLCLTLASFSQGVGIASLVPLVSVIIEGEAGQSSAISKFTVEILGSVGLSANFGVLLALFVSAILLKAALIIVAMLYVGYSMAEVSRGLRARLVDALLAVEWRFFTHKPLGSVVNAIGLESALSASVYINVARYIASLLQTVIYVGVAFAISWKLALAGLAIGILILISLHRFVRMSRRAGKRSIRGTRELTTYISDAVLGIKPLKAMARQNRFAALFHEKILAIRDNQRREIISRQLQKSLQEPILVVFVAGGLFLLIQEFGLPVAEVLVMGIVVERVVKTIGRMQTQLQDARVAEAAYFSAESMIREAEDGKERHIGTSPAVFERDCRFDEVSFGYEEKLVLDRFSLDIPAKQLTLLVGPSGAGKTTITDLLLGFYHPHAGRILVDGTDLKDIDIVSWRRLIGYVPQELMLLNDSIKVNVTLGDPELSDAEIERALRLAGAWDFVSQLPQGTATVVGEKGGKLSGGQRQRIALARALVNRPKLLILDEVTSALDEASEAAICENVQELAQQIAILAISHRPAWLKIADNIVKLQSDDFAAFEGAAE